MTSPTCWFSSDGHAAQRNHSGVHIHKPYCMSTLHSRHQKKMGLDFKAFLCNKPCHSNVRLVWTSLIEIVLCLSWGLVTQMGKTLIIHRQVRTPTPHPPKFGEFCLTTPWMPNFCWFSKFCTCNPVISPSYSPLDLQSSPKSWFSPTSSLFSLESWSQTGHLVASANVMMGKGPLF